MDPDAIVAVLTVFIVIGLPVLSYTLIKLARIMKGDSSKYKDSPTTAHEEAQIMQNLHSGLSRLEKRIESLETIILDNRK